MSEPKSRELRAVRIEVAITMCIQNPSLYANLLEQEKHFNPTRETLHVKILRELMRLEPCIKNILSFYYKREPR